MLEIENPKAEVGWSALSLKISNPVGQLPQLLFKAERFKQQRLKNQRKSLSGTS